MAAGSPSSSRRPTRGSSTPHSPNWTPRSPPRSPSAPRSLEPGAHSKTHSRPASPTPRSPRQLKDDSTVNIGAGKPVRGASGPGVTVGPTSEFSLFFRVKPGEGESLRAALRDLQDTPGYRPGDHGLAISTIHEARFVLFDDDTRLAFITSFDGPWDVYMEDFFTSGPTLALFDVIFRQ